MNLKGAVFWLKNVLAQVWTQLFVQADSFFPPFFLWPNPTLTPSTHLWMDPIFSLHRQLWSVRSIWRRPSWMFCHDTGTQCLGGSGMCPFSPTFNIDHVYIRVAVCECVLPVRHHCRGVSLFRDGSWRTDARMLHVQHTELQLLLFNITVPQISI